MRYQVLHKDGGFKILEAICCSDHRGPSAEEASPIHAISIPRRGAFVMHMRGQKFVADQSQAVFLTKNEPYRVSHPIGCGDNCTVLCFAEKDIVEVARHHAPHLEDRPKAPFPVSHATIGAEVALRAQLISHRLRSGRAAELEVSDTAYQVLDGVLAAAVERSTPQARVARRRRHTTRLHRDQVEAARLFILDKPQDPWRLEALAKRVNASPFHLSRIFRELTGTTIHKFHLRVRLASAVERILDGEDNFADLAFRLGFSSHSHFSAAIRSLFGRTPLEIGRLAINRDI